MLQHVFFSLKQPTGLFLANRARWSSSDDSEDATSRSARNGRGASEPTETSESASPGDVGLTKFPQNGQDVSTMLVFFGTRNTKKAL